MDLPPEIDDVPESPHLRELVGPLGKDGDGAVSELESIDGLGHVE